MYVISMKWEDLFPSILIDNVYITYYSSCIQIEEGKNKSKPKILFSSHHYTPLFDRWIHRIHDSTEYIPSDSYYRIHFKSKLCERNTFFHVACWIHLWDEILKDKSQINECFYWEIFRTDFPHYPFPKTGENSCIILRYLLS